MRILFASLGSRGDLNPILALAAACRERGHAVSVAAAGSFREHVEASGFAAWPLRPDVLCAAGQVRHFSDPSKGPERLLRTEVFPASEATYSDLLTAARGADLLVVGELLYVAPLVAGTLGVPWVTVILAPSSFLSVSDPCVLAPLPALSRLGRFSHWPLRAVLALGRHLTERWARPLRDLERRLGRTPVANPVYAGKHSPHLVLTLFPEFFAPKQTDWPQNALQTGFPFFQQPSETTLAADVLAFLDAGPPPVVFTLGSAVVMMADDFYDLAEEAVGRIGCRAICLVGGAPGPASVSGGILRAPYIPLEAVFPRAAAAVHHGGIGSCAMALRSGIPSVVIPFGYDQPDNGARLERLGVACVVRRRGLTARLLEQGLRRVLEDGTMSCRARELARQIHPDRDMARSIEAIEQAASPAATHKI